MKYAKSYVCLSELRKLLRDSIEACYSIQDPQILSAVAQYSSICLSVENVTELVKAPKTCRSTGSQDELLQENVYAGRSALSHIRTACSNHVKTLCTNTSQRGALKHAQHIPSILSSLANIVNAINSVLLLVIIQLHATVIKNLDTKLRDLIASSEESQERSLSISSPTKQPNSNQPSLRDLLQPWSISLIQIELRLAYTYAISLTSCHHIYPNHPQLLNVHLLGCLLADAPSHPSHIAPGLVSYNSDVMVAARSGNEEGLRKILCEEQGSEYSFTIASLTPIFFAIESGSVATVKCLLQHGVGVNDTFGRNGTVPLAAALQFRYTHIVSLLMSVGASFQYRNANGWSLLFYLWFKEARDASAYPLLALLYSTPWFESLHKDVYDKDGWTVMHRAAVYGSSEDVRWLIEFGVDPFALTQTWEADRLEGECEHYSVLQQVVLDGLVNIVEVLLPLYSKKFGNVDLPNEIGWTLLHMAVEQQHIDVVRMLVWNRADLRASTKPTLSGIEGDTKARSYDAFSLAKKAGPDFNGQFRHIIEEFWLVQNPSPTTNSRLAPTMKMRQRQCRAQRMMKSALIKSTVSNPPVCPQQQPCPLDHNESYRDTTLSQNARAHLGNKYNTFYLNNCKFARTKSGNISRRSLLRKKFLERKQDRLLMP